MLVLSQQPQLRTVAAIVMVVVASAGTTIEASRSATGQDGRAVGQGEVPTGPDPNDPDQGWPDQGWPDQGWPDQGWPDQGWPDPSRPAPTGQPTPLG